VEVEVTMRLMVKSGATAGQQRHSGLITYFAYSAHKIKFIKMHET